MRLKNIHARSAERFCTITSIFVFARTVGGESCKKMNNSQKKYIERRFAGLCISCGQADDRTRAGHSRCQSCYDKYTYNRKELPRERRDEDNAEKREWWAMRKKAHVCAQCGRQDARTITGKCYCLQCAKKKAESAKKSRASGRERELGQERRDRWREQGLCSCCGKPKNDDNYRMCIDCRVRAKYRKLKRKIARGWKPRGTNGTCYQCNRAPAMEGKRLCAACYAKKLKMPQIYREVKEDGNGNNS